MKDYREKELKYLLIVISLLAIKFSVIDFGVANDANWLSMIDGAISVSALSLVGFIIDCM